MFNKIFVEKEVLEQDYTQRILSQFSKITPQVIDSVDKVWGRVKKPYLQKRETLSLFIGRKKGELVKLAPDAYGLGKEKHYYFVHAYNCIYECQYCYLQGHFHTPDIVLYTNHDEIIAQMQKVVDEDPKHNPWFHAGEYSDSLALSHITQEWAEYFDFFKKNSLAKLELRTKSVNIKPIIDLPAHPNIYVSFTVASEQAGKNFDVRCPSIKARLSAIEKLVKKGFNIGIHFDPLIFQDDFESQYDLVIEKLFEILPQEQLGYISIGVVRFTKPVYHQVTQNYPDSPLLAENFTRSFDGKVRYPRTVRMWMMNKVKQLCLKYNVNEQKIYLCMEEDE